MTARIPDPENAGCHFIAFVTEAVQISHEEHRCHRLAPS